MGKIWVEVCLISARGLRRTSSLWKLQWFAVGWIDTNNKYCTRIDASGNANPVWKTKFSTLVDPSDPNFQDMALHVEVYSREPVFLRERLLGTATVILKEFLEKYLKNSEVPKPVEELGSFQLRKKNSDKPQGFVDISIRISEEREEPSAYQSTSDQEGFKLMDNGNGINLGNEYGPLRSHVPPTVKQPGSQPQTSSQYARTQPFDRNYSNLPTGSSYGPASGTNSQPIRTPSPPPPPPPPPPPSNVGYVPTFLPRTDNLQPSFTNMPSSAPAPGRGRGLGIGMGLGAGALAAGAVIFGDDFMSGFDFPRGLQDASLTISTDPPF